MPDGTVEDSRDPNSPQWGYLSPNLKDEYEEYANDKDGNILAPDWNDKILFLHHQRGNNNQTRFFKRNDAVEFEMVRATVTIYRGNNPELDVDNQRFPITRQIWVALVT